MEIKITNIQTLCLHDGPGIRTTVFLSGCPLRCTWCHNPETQSGKTFLAFEKGRCTACRCCSACPRGVHRFTPEHEIQRRDCVLCQACIDLCFQNALSLSQRLLSMDEFQKIVQRQRRVAGEDGGITFSGGEPLSQGETFLTFLRSTDAHRAVETCGYADESLFCRMLEAADYIMFDLKLANDTLHRRYTGVSNRLILRNLEHLRRSGKPFLLRTPLIPAITDTPENLSAIREIVRDDPWETLPFNPLTPAKYERIGQDFNL